MSEATTTAIYLAVALLNLLITGWKTLALLRERTPTLALITASFALSVLVYIAASPAGYRIIGEATDLPSAATLPVYLGIVTCYAITHVLTLLWVPLSPARLRPVRQRVIFWMTGYGAALTFMTVTFCEADLEGPADPMRFNTTFVEGDPLVLAFLVVFLGTLSCATLSTARLTRQSVLDDPDVRHAVDCFSVGTMIVFGYVVCNAPAVLLAATGIHVLDGAGVLGSAFGVVGAFITSYGMTGAAISAWLRERRDIRALQPLWNLVVAGVDARLAFGPGDKVGLRVVNVRFTLHRRVIEILDGMRVLRVWFSPLPGASVRQLVDSLGEEANNVDLDSLIAAATLRDAVTRFVAARSAAAGQGSGPPPDTATLPLLGEGTAASDERSRLLLIARHLKHPIVTAALRDTERREQPQAPEALVGPAR